MLTYLLTGFASLATAIIGVRLYNIYSSWGNYRQMIKQFGGNSVRDFTIIITGCNSGIGKETARELYKNGCRIIMANRNQSQTEEIIKEFRKQFPLSSGELIYKNLDLTSMNSVKQFSNDIITNEPRLDLLISNAAVFGAPTRLTDDGFEINMQINHLAPALLTRLLLPKLQSNINESQEIPIRRIVVVTSTLTKHGSANYQEFLSKTSNDKLKEVVVQHGRDIYASTKLANLQFMRSLSKQKNLIKNVEICLASPGFCYTRLHRYTSRSHLLLMSLFLPLFFMIMKSPRQGAQTLIGCSMISKVRSDVLYHNCKENENFFQNGIVADSILTQEVYDKTMKTIGEYL